MTRRSVSKSGARAGVTLLELILVMMLLGIIVGGGLGMFAALDLGRRQAVGLVKNVLRTAQNSAIASHAPARVRFDVAGGTLAGEALQVVGTWQFEERSLRGAFRLDGTATNHEFVPGYLGDAIAFSGRVGSYAEIAIEHDSAWNFAEGFAIECVVRRDPDGAGRLVQVGSIASILLNATGAVRTKFTTRVEQDGRPQRGGDVILDSAPGLVVADRWTPIRVEYDRQRFALFVDGFLVEEIEETAPVWQVDGPLLLSDNRRPYAGAIDDLSVSVMVAEEPVDLPDTVAFVSNTPPFVAFDAGGRLDRRQHPASFQLELAFEDGTSSKITLGTYGVVE